VSHHRAARAIIRQSVVCAFFWIPAQPIKDTKANIAGRPAETSIFLSNYAHRPILIAHADRMHRRNVYNASGSAASCQVFRRRVHVGERGSLVRR